MPYDFDRAGRGKGGLIIGADIVAVVVIGIWQALSALSRWGFNPKQVSARSSMVLAAPTSARRLARATSTSMMIEALRSIG